jgi:hypothetical protein
MEFRNWLENESQTMRNFIQAKLNFPDADFWVIRRGTPDEVGRPVKEFDPERIGIKVTSEALMPDYLFYTMRLWHSEGRFKQVATGTIKLVHIRTSDILNIPIA